MRGLSVLVSAGGLVCASGLGQQQCLACGTPTVLADDNCKRFQKLTGSVLTATSFEGRHGHASAIFPHPETKELALWVVGGRGEEYQKWNFVNTFRHADVWVTDDGIDWERRVELYGDFTARTDVAFLLEDVQNPGDVAPWWERFGHSLDVIEAYDADADAPVLVMLLCGGFTPRPDDDVWVSEDGIDWRLVGRAPWSARGYHASAVFRGRVHIIGGSPLNNDVWAGNVTRRGGAWAMDWDNVGAATGTYEDETAWSTSDGETRWSPRAGHAATVQFSIDVNGTSNELLYLTGGYASWPAGHPLWDEQRARNDVWRTADGANWELIASAAPWASRAWHSFVTWTDLTSPFLDISLGANDDAEYGRDVPRMWLAGGGYVGSKGNNIVRFVDGCYDLWWTRDGVSWTEVTLADAAGTGLCTTLEPYKVDDVDVYLGKYGHSMVPFWRKTENNYVCRDPPTLNEGNFICMDSVYANLYIPALFFIAGDWGHYDESSLKSSAQVYASRATILCEIDGHSCPDAQAVRDQGGSPASSRRMLDVDTSEVLTMAGTCPDPYIAGRTTGCTTGCLVDEGQLVQVFWEAKNATEPVEAANKPDFPYTVYDFTKWRENATAASGIHPYAPSTAKFLNGYVARMHGCRCDAPRQGEYCEIYDTPSAARATGPRALSLALAAAALLWAIPS
ncbi:hypothetical protein M885DRAFT_468602 [Pelagophyceae sp. CCMP2097]|nr:hypothetical protein M885DRAFT_468602 [Pelagophyceae sp. CCMP2097]|mmetsp:Transcript_27825/g.93561  ORF Transcript_27825/g.93561 Transcript_27825/m.93561 type:complete len:679 (+) Transcript_27825:96-2132(+)